ncbi:helix-turn-helix domain-containing protein [Enterococcus wangshanyuanii]|uniref:HTH cro/C1-type domain-containing protein n=1 Tax=Enterococcus wangshanyuanii TaxID=2005703 RepID=A0ABQ1NEG1_9ENTE|nr:helix-turn-helix transcriptional regulator [Enterococcus wangshanyuanii]GGC74532.1 hypothetical protein GCM10011573_00020 [Enterococcus wangshanyuanii]
MNTKELVKDLARRKHLSLAELERKLDISNGTIGKWDKSQPSIEPLKKLADFFNVSTDYLLGRVDDPHLNFYDDKTFDAIAKSFAAENETYTQLFESLPLLSDEELVIVNNLVQSLLGLNQKKS